MEGRGGPFLPSPSRASDTKGTHNKEPLTESSRAVLSVPTNYNSRLNCVLVRYALFDDYPESSSDLASMSSFSTPKCYSVPCVFQSQKLLLLFFS